MHCSASMLFMALLLTLASLPLPLEAGGSSAHSMNVRSWQSRPSSSGGDLPAVKIGLPTTFSIRDARYYLANQMLFAYELFFGYHVQEHGGILLNGTRRPIALYLVDIGDSDASIRLAMNELINGTGLELFLGPYSSQLTEPVADAVHGAGGLLVSGGADMTSVFANRPHVFGTLPDEGSYDNMVLEMLGMAHGAVPKTLWYLTDSPDTQRFVGLAARYSITVVNATVLPKGQSIIDMWTLVEELVGRLVVSDPDIVFAKLHDDDMCHALARAAWDAGYSPKALVMAVCAAGKDLVKQMGFAGQYVLHVSAWQALEDSRGPLTGSWTMRNFTDRFEFSYNVVPSYQVTSAFSAAAMLVHGIEQANSLDPQAVASALRNTQVGSMFGNVSFDTNGQGVARPKVLQYKSSWESGPVLVYPCGPCNGTLVYPRPNRSYIDCENLDPGLQTRYGWLDGMCQACPLGRVSEVANESRRVCTPCSSGTEGVIGEGQLQECRLCLPGTFSSEQGSSHCSDCPMGEFASRRGLTSCTPCAAGSTAGSTGSKQCVDCLRGTYQNHTGESACLRCEAGRFGPHRGATRCEDCPATFTTSGTGFARRDACSCPRGTFDPSVWMVSDERGSPHCEACKEGISCEVGAPVELAPGYYADEGDFNPLLGPWRCAISEVCPGGPPGSCSSTFEGIACSFCPEGQASILRADCEDCGIRKFMPAFFFVGVIVIFVGLYYLANARIVKITTVKMSATITASIAITVVQQLGMLYKLNIPWPDGVRIILEFAAFFVVDIDTLGLECFMGREPVQRYLALFIMPFSAMVLLLLLVMGSRLLPVLTRRRLSAWSFPKSFNVFGSMAQIFFISLTSIATMVLQCYNHPNGKVSMVRFPSIICFESDHVGILIMGALMLFLLVIPFMALSIWGCYTTYHQTQLKGVNVRELEMYRFLIFRYSPMVWWWGNVFNMRQLLLGFTPMITPREPMVQLCWILIVLLLYVVAATAYCPWRSIEMNIFDICTTILFILIIMAASALLPSGRWINWYELALMVMIITTLAISAVAILYSLLQRIVHGPDHPYGVSFPKHANIDDFADSWRMLMKRTSSLSEGEHRGKVRCMDSFERHTIDKAMRILSMSFDVGKLSYRGWKASSAKWQPRAKALRMLPSWDAVEHAERHSRVTSARKSATKQPEEEEEPAGDSSESSEVVCDEKSGVLHSTYTVQSRFRSRVAEDSCVGGTEPQLPEAVKLSEPPSPTEPEGGGGGSSSSAALDEILGLISLNVLVPPPIGASGGDVEEPKSAFARSLVPPLHLEALTTNWNRLPANVRPTLRAPRGPSKEAPGGAAPKEPPLPQPRPQHEGRLESPDKAPSRTSSKASSQKVVTLQMPPHRTSLGSRSASQPPPPPHDPRRPPSPDVRPL